MSPTTVTGEEILETFGASWRRGTGRAGGAERSVMVRHREARGLAGSIGAARDVRMKRGRGRAGQHHKDLLQAFAQLHHLLLLQNLHVAASLDTLVQVQHRPPPAANLPNPPAPSLLNQRTTLMFASFSTLTTLPSSPSSVGLQRFSRSRSLARPRARALSLSPLYLPLHAVLFMRNCSTRSHMCAQIHATRAHTRTYVRTRLLFPPPLSLLPFPLSFSRGRQVSSEHPHPSTPLLQQQTQQQRGKRGRRR